MPTTRLELAGLGLALFLTLGAAGYTVGSTLGERLFILAVERWGQNVKADQITELGQTQTIDGVTVTLERAYILGDQIGIEYTVSGTPAPYLDEGGNYHDFSPLQLGTLTDSQGVELTATTGSGVTGRSDVLGVELAPGTGRFVPVFDAPALHGSTDLRLHFSVSFAEFLSKGSSFRTPERGQSENPNESQALAYQTGVEPFAGPFTFEFTVPVVSSAQGPEHN